MQKNEVKYEKDINEIFEEILLSEDCIISESYKKGYALGLNDFNKEAYHLGYHRGAELGAELGYYYGFIKKQQNTENSEKIQKILTNLQHSIETFPKENDDKTDIIKLADDIRAKFKKLCALLKIDYTVPRPNRLTF